MKFQVMPIAISLLLMTVIYSTVKTQNLGIFAIDEDIHKNVTELISSKGYPVENHVVQTEDGYLISIQRILYGKNDSRTSRKPAVLLLHGTFQSSADWVINFPHQSFGFILADAGYDVWLGNIRGNTYGRRHINLNPSASAFWNFSFDEMAKYDLPAMIDYVLNKTGNEQLIYIGYSLGSRIAFALLSESPTYNHKIKLNMAFAPTTAGVNTKSPIKYIYILAEKFYLLLKAIGINEILSDGPFRTIIAETVCSSPARFLCKEMLFLLYGGDNKQLNETRLPVYNAHTPAGTSIKLLVHYGQMAKAKKFQKYNYGKDNQDHYNQTNPPEYDVTQITTPTALFWSLGDPVADPKDVSTLQGKLKSTVKSYCVKYKDFSHVDFVLAMDANKLLYEEALATLQQYVI